MATDLRLGDLVVFTMSADDAARTSQFESAWVTRADDKHLCVVIGLEPQTRDMTRDIRVWDTAETDWFMASADSFEHVGTVS